MLCSVTEMTRRAHQCFGELAVSSLVTSVRCYDAGCICEKNDSAFFRISSGVRSWVC
jgi:hypothetical protein